MKIQIHFRKEILYFLPIVFSLQSCSTIFNLPANGEKSTLGEVTNLTTELKEIPPPKDKIVVGVYKFRDQTGQYKPSETGSNWSTAVPQGTTTILIKALEDSKWFIPIERENIANLLNERQIIRSTRQEYAKDGDKNSQMLPPLLYAGILLEGGIISYDSNVMTGGVGARYFGIGGSTQYRQDRITVYLRAVSTLNGEILKTVYVSKNILSTGVSGNFFKYIDTERLLESEVGFTQNEPVQLAVTEAIEKAVKTLIIEGLQNDIWGKGIDKNRVPYYNLISGYKKENEANNQRLLGNKVENTVRKSNFITLNVEGQQINGDYKNAANTIGSKVGIGFFLNKNINLEASVNTVKIKNTGIIERDYFGPEFNIQYLFLPQFKFTPFVYAGFGALFSDHDPFVKANLGGGLDYLISDNFSARTYFQYDFGFKDKLDGFVSGKQNDNIMRIGLGINYYFGNQQK